MIDRLRSLLGGGQYVAVKRLAQGLLVDASASQSEKGEAALMGAKAAMHLREAYLADSFARKALECAQQTEDPLMEGKAYFYLATARLAIGDYAEVRVYLALYLAGLQRWPELDATHTAHAYINLAQACRNQRLFGDALANYTRALNRFLATGDTRGQVQVHHQISWTLLLAGQTEEAREHLALALECGELDPDLAVHQLTHEALLHLEEGNIPAAMARATEVLQPSRPEVSPASKAVACYVTAKSAIANGQHAMARQMVDMAYELAMEAGLSHVINLITSLRAALPAEHPTSPE